MRDYGALKATLDDGVAQLGKLDIVSANAGIFSYGTLDQLSETAWQDMIDTNLAGVWHAAKAGRVLVRRRRAEPPRPARGAAATDLARDLARLGHGRMLLAGGYRDIAPALASLFTG